MSVSSLTINIVVTMPALWRMVFIDLQVLNFLFVSNVGNRV